ncbi:Hypothetical predicted protein [Cloeon dipterum]|uniref:X-box-binding protein 1 n=1 Tax=Cloeon dipterum TaxID=197152 RepID=A0A8S1CDB3_9INSE|nr:Hypothetical predicted protein [Cloeon dipterum]
MAAKTILIALPCGPRDKLPLPPRVPAISRTVERIKVEVDDEEGYGFVKERNRKRKLDNLTTEEKILRKKMKNRVAAQNSRDKKKARMDDLEKELALAREQIKQLEAANAILLKQRTCTMCGEKVSSQGPQDFVPAVSKPDIPLQKGRGHRLETLLPAWCSAWVLLLALTANKHQLKQKTMQELTPTLKTLVDRRVMKDIRAERMKWWGSHQNMWNPKKKVA